jgi:hypothetical protein
MRILDWWTARKRKIERTKRSGAISDDEALIAQHAPELTGMGFVDGGAFILDQIDTFNKTATPEQSLELTARLQASHVSWEEEGLTMPYWANLVVLRRLQADISSGSFCA